MRIRWTPFVASGVEYLIVAANAAIGSFPQRSLSLATQSWRIQRKQVNGARRTVQPAKKVPGVEPDWCVD